MNIFLNKFKKFEGGKLFFSFLKKINLTKNFKYKEYVGQTSGIKFYCMRLKKWVIFDNDAEITEYIKEKCKDIIYFDINYCNYLPVLNNVELLFKAFDREHGTFGSFYDSSFHYKLTRSQMQICLYYGLILVVFSKYDDFDLFWDCKILEWRYKVKNYYNLKFL